MKTVTLYSDHSRNATLFPNVGLKVFSFVTIFETFVN